MASIKSLQGGTSGAGPEPSGSFDLEGTATLPGTQDENVQKSTEIKDSVKMKLKNFRF